MAKFIRNPARVKQCLKELPTGQLLVTEACRIQIPTRFAQRGLAQIGIENFIYGAYPIILEDGSYTVSNINAMVKISPFKTLNVEMNGVPYYEFHFEANSIIIETLHLICQGDIIFNVFDEFIFKGNVPWYFGYEDLGKLFDTADYHAKTKVNENLEVIELIASMVARNPDDRTKYYRTIIEKFEDMRTKPSANVPLNSVLYSATNTLNKLAGSYFNDGIVSALVNPSTEVERIETLLRT